MQNTNENVRQMIRWLRWAPGERWFGYELQVVLASDIQADRMLLEIGMYTFENTDHSIGFDLARAYYDRTTRRDVLQVAYGEDKLAELDWADVRDSLLIGELDLTRDGMPVLSSSGAEGIGTVTLYQDGQVVCTMRSDRFVSLLDDFYANQSDRIEE